MRRGGRWKEREGEREREGGREGEREGGREKEFMNIPSSINFNACDDACSADAGTLLHVLLD